MKAIKHIIFVAEDGEVNTVHLPPESLPVCFIRPPTVDELRACDEVWQLFKDQRARMQAMQAKPKRRESAN